MVTLCIECRTLVLRYRRINHLWKKVFMFAVCFVIAVGIIECIFRIQSGEKPKEIKKVNETNKKITGRKIESYKHCLGVYMYETSHIIIPDYHNLQQLPVAVLSCIYQRYVTTLQVLCSEPKRFGNVDVGGFRLCSDHGIAPESDSIIITNHPKTSKRFVKQTREMFNCRVMFHSMETAKSVFSSLELAFKVYGSKISVLILLVTQSDFPHLLDLAKHISSTRIKQVVLEIHYENTSKTDLLHLLQFFRQLYRSYYRVYWFDRNFECVHENRSKCYTVNMRLLTPKISFSQDSISTENSELSDLPKVEPNGLNYLERAKTVEYHDIVTRYISKHQILCREILRLGKVLDGGWDVCHDIRFRPKSPCIVYSFGISFDFSFDEDMASTYGCEVYSFDPFMGMSSFLHKKNVNFYDIGIGDKNENININGSTAQLMNLESIMRKFGHLDKRIDVLKIDIEGNEIQSLAEMINSGVLKNVAQLYFEFHNYYDVGTLRKLYDIGFRIFWAHQNPFRALYTKNETLCPMMEVYFVNVNAK